MKRAGGIAPGMTHDVFISHLTEDGAVADAALERRGIGCWIAPRDLGPAGDASAAIACSRLFLLIFTAGTNAAPRMQRELEQAVGASLPILALRIADVAPAPALGFLIPEWLDALTPPVAPHLDYLGDRVLQLLGRTRRGPLLPSLPPRPFPPARRRGPRWLPIALAGLGGLAAIALAAAYVSAGSAQP